MTTPTKPDCCEAMRHWLRDGHMDFGYPNMHGVPFDCDGTRLGNDDAARLGGVFGCWTASDMIHELWGDDAVRSVRIRYCPWCGACVDEREKL